MSRRWALGLGALTLVGASAVATQWASAVEGDDPYDDAAPTLSWEGHTAIFDQVGNRVGWITTGGGSDGSIVVQLPASYSAREGNPSAVGVKIVYDDDGDAIGILGSRGFQEGVLRNGTDLDPDVRQQIIDDAISNVSVSTVPPNGAPANPD